MADIMKCGEFFQSHKNEIKELAVRVGKPGSRMFGYRFITAEMLASAPERFIEITDEEEVEVAALLISALDDLNRTVERTVCVISELLG